MRGKNFYLWCLVTFFTLTLFLTPTLYGQTKGKIAGVIKDANTGDPLVGVNVVVKGTYL